MKRKWGTAYAVLLLVLMITGSIFAYIFAWKNGTKDCIFSVIGFFSGVVLAPVVHELGHILFAKFNAMEIEYAKFFCFQFIRKEGKLRFSLISPFLEDQTQAIPKSGENVRNRAVFYVLGGLIAEGTLFLLVTVSAVGLTVIGLTNYFLWGIVPYTGYLFLLNAMPLEYAGGKTDALVYLGILKNEPAEQVMLSAMEIQGRLYAGERFLEINEDLFFDLPQLREGDPLFALILDLRYRYYLDKNETENAAKQLNRLVTLQEYLPENKVQELAAELTYFHSISGNLEEAEACGNCCKEYLQGNTVLAKRALVAYSKAFGKEEAVKPLLAQAETILQTERVKGLVKHERALLARLTSEDKA